MSDKDVARIHDELKDIMFALVEYGANNPHLANDALRLVALNYLNDVVELFIEIDEGKA